MIYSPPKFRDDLTVSEQRTGGEIIFIVKEPVKGQFFRMREVERFIAVQCDGTTSLDVIRQRTEEKFGGSLPAEMLAAFVKNLEKAGLLETEGGKRGRPDGRQRRISGGPLLFRVKLLDPNRLLDKLIGKVRFCFTPYFMVISAVMILLAVGIVTTQLGEIGQSVGRFYNFSGLPLILAVVFLVITGHEFAHGLTCKYFGGEVREMGFMMIYFQPALYCNVSDAWLFPEKSKRLWVTFAGPYFELFLWSLATMLWRLTEEDTLINYVGFIVMTSSGVKTLFNFNPLIKLDGYYLLSDYLGMPNLRRKSFRFVGDGIKRLFGAVAQNPVEVSARERRAYLAYGLMGSVGSFSALGLAFAALGRYLVDQNQPMAFVFFAGFLGAKFRRRIRNLFGKPSSKSTSSSDLEDEDDSFDSDDSNTSAPERAVADAKAQPKRGNRKPLRFKKTLIAVVLAAVAVPILFLGKSELKIRGLFNVLPIHNADIRAEVEAIVEEINVDEGDVVQAGDVIARLSDRDVRADLRKTEADIDQSRAKLKMLEAGPTIEEIELAKAAVTREQDRVAYARIRLVRDKALVEQNLLSRKDFDDTQEQAATAENDMNTAKGKLKVLLGGARPEEIEANKAEIARLETQRRFLEEQLQLLNVRSPISGIVATPSVQLKEMKHQLAKKGDLIAKVYDIREITAEIVVSERDIADVRVGQTVWLKARAHPEETFHGTITAIATSAMVNSSSSSIFSGQTPSGTTAFSRANVSSKTLLVMTRIQNRSLLLKPEMTGPAKIFCGQKRIFDLLTRRVARTIKVEFWSWM